MDKAQNNMINALMIKTALTKELRMSSAICPQLTMHTMVETESSTSNVGTWQGSSLQFLFNIMSEATGTVKREKKKVIMIKR